MWAFVHTVPFIFFHAATDERRGESPFPFPSHLCTVKCPSARPDFGKSGDGRGKNHVSVKAALFSYDMNVRSAISGHESTGAHFTTTNLCALISTASATITK